MPGTVITTAQIDNMSQTFIAPALKVREHSPVMAMITDRKRLPNGYGLVYNEPYLSAISASQLVDGMSFDSPSGFSDTNIQVTALEYGVQTLVTLLTNDQVRENLLEAAGTLMANAMEYKRDTTGLTMLDGFGNSVGSGTATPVVGHINAATYMIRAGLAGSGGVARTGARATGDPPTGPLYAVLHDLQIRALAAQNSGLFSGSSDGAIGTTAATFNFGTNRVGISDWQAKWITDHVRNINIDGARLIADNNLTIASNAAKGGVFARDAIIHLSYRAPNHYTFVEPDGRAVRMTYSEMWGWGERADPWGWELNLASPVPTT